MRSNDVGLRSIRVGPADLATLFMNVYICPLADADADRTVAELLKELDDNQGRLKVDVLASAVYCCHMNDENQEFWHPRDWSFKKFLKALLPERFRYDYYYHWIIEEVGDAKKATVNV